MAVLDTPMRGAAVKMIGTFGTNATLVIPGTTQDPNTAVVSGSDTTETHKVVLSTYAANEIDGQKILVGDMRVLLAAQDWTNTPESGAGYRLRVTGKELRIVNVEAVYSGDQVAIYDVQARA